MAQNQFTFGDSYSLDEFKAKQSKVKGVEVKHIDLLEKEVKDANGKTVMNENGQPVTVTFFAWGKNKGETGLVSKTLDKTKEIVISAVSWEASADGKYPSGSGFLMHNQGGTAKLITRL